MTKKLKLICTNSVTCLVLISMIACNLNYNTGTKHSVTASELRSEMPSILDAQMDTINEYLDDDLKDAINQGTRGTPLSGAQIVEYTLSEDKGFEYLNFCYQVNSAKLSGETTYLMDAASDLLDEENYNNLCNQIEEAKEELESSAEQVVRGLPVSQQKAFYKELKSLVVRTTVLLTAGIVYAIIPEGVFWGKVSAAAAISVGAGLTAMTIMSIYERYKFGAEDKNQSYEDWIKEMIKQPKADYAIATSALALGNTFEQGPVVAGIVLCVFAVFKVADAARTMMLNYNFDA